MTMMQSTMHAFMQELSALIAERRKTLTENVVSGVAVTSFDQYREYVGRLAELDEVREMMGEAASNVSKR
jgi:hypothetical protein